MANSYFGAGDHSKFYGLKEVADCALYPTDATLTIAYDGTKVTVTGAKPSSNAVGQDAEYTSPLVFDTLKVTNFEMSSDETSAKGGKGNPELLNWSYGKSLSFSMEDALLSSDTLHLLYGSQKRSTAGDGIIVIDGGTFPGAYMMVGITVIRNLVTGNDTPFVFVIPKVQFQVTGTLTMQAEGDPSTFEMSAKCLAQTITEKIGSDGSEAERKDALVVFLDCHQLTASKNVVLKASA